MPVSWFDGWASVQSGISPPLVVPLGGNWQPGDLRLLPVSTSSSRSFTTPSGWTALYSGGTGSRTLSVLARELGSGDTDPAIPVVGAAGPNIADSGVTLRGADNSAVLAATPTLREGSSRNVAAPSIPVTAGLLLTVHFITRTDGAANTGSWGSPSGMSLVASALSDGPMGYNVLLAAAPVSAGNSGDRTATAASSGSWTGVSVFIPEAPEPEPAGPEPGRFLLAG